MKQMKNSQIEAHTQKLERLLAEIRKFLVVKDHNWVSGSNLAPDPTWCWCWMTIIHWSCLPSMLKWQIMCSNTKFRWDI